MCSRWLASLTSVLPYPTISSSTRRMALGSLERMITLSFEEANIEQEVCSRHAQRVRAIIFFMAYGGVRDAVYFSRWGWFCKFFLFSAVCLYVVVECALYCSTLWLFRFC